MSLLKQILSNQSHWQVNKDFAREYGLECAVLMTELIDKWSYYDFTEWFYNTSESIEEFTTLTYHKQKKCIEVLTNAGFIETSLKGTPAKQHFKVIESQILNFFNSSFRKIRKLDLEKFETNNNIDNKNILLNKKINKKISDEENSTDLDAKKESKKEGPAAFVEWFNSIAGRRFKCDSKIERSFKARIREGYSKKDLMKATLNAHKDQYHKDNNYQYLTPEFILRSDKLNKFLNVLENEKPVETNKENYSLDRSQRIDHSNL